ncbi:hypothetical protein HYG77_16695 [Rhodococcus sp. ZPP]|uniref:hypothetical protein n=1 Tax=Rhodococcus sp. ZPP TaxID=2749906 RepID=UPI001AD8840A|nr:hypothetical protein [Rhodococcus sp. ZPP]QTJ67061.1 hypothetical protein HYG77_16695 [Rhodococcus sp. ZPP]
MNATGKFAGFTLGLVAVFAAATGVGALVGPDIDEPTSHAADDPGHGSAGDGTEGHNTGGHDPGGHPEAADATPKGLRSTQDGYTLELASSIAATGTEVPVQFRILDHTGTPVTRYADQHEKQLHLIAVRRDLTGYQHVHPSLDESGTWSVSLDLARAGDYRVFADFMPAGGDALTLGTDLRVAGSYDPQVLPTAETTTTVDGYTVTLDGTLEPGQTSTLTLAVGRDGSPVTDLQPYLGAYGHLVALRTADLGYLHVHPEGHPGDGVTPAGPGIDFAVTAPSPGEYRLFLDFQHAGAVHTAEFTVSAHSEEE